MSSEQIFEDKKAMSMEVIDHASIAAAEAAKARVQAAYIVAMKRPRNQMESRDRILNACKRPAFAERVEYAKPVSGKKVRGPSVRFAELAIREWGNCLTETQVFYEDINVKRIRMTVTDLETNSSHSKEITVQKTVERKKIFEDREVLGHRRNTSNELVYIVKATDDEIYNKEAALISKALRNEGLRLIPSDIIDEAIEIARKTLLKRDEEDPERERKKIFDSFSEIGISPKELMKYIGHERDKLSPVELQDLRAVYRAIRDGDAKWEDYITENNEEQKKEKSASAAGLKNKLKKDMGDSSQSESESSINGAGDERSSSEPVPDSPDENPRYDALNKLCESKGIPIGKLIELTRKLGFHDIGTEAGIEEFTMYVRERIDKGKQSQIENLFLVNNLSMEKRAKLLEQVGCQYIWELDDKKFNGIVNTLTPKKGRK